MNLSRGFWRRLHSSVVVSDRDHCCVSAYIRWYYAAVARRAMKNSHPCTPKTVARMIRRLCSGFSSCWLWTCACVLYQLINTNLTHFRRSSRSPIAHTYYNLSHCGMAGRPPPSSSHIPGHSFGRLVLRYRVIAMKAEYVVSCSYLVLRAYRRLNGNQKQDHELKPRISYCVNHADLHQRLCPAKIHRPTTSRHLRTY